MSRRQRPQLQEGWLGAQVKFSDLNMSVYSHRSAEFDVLDDNGVIVVIRTGRPVKLMAKLYNAQNKNRLLNEYVLIQRKDDQQIMFHLGFTENGYYQFQIFALDEFNVSELLPNVYNYLINVDGLHRPAIPIAKALTKFYDDYCYLEEPLALTSRDRDVDQIKFQLSVPGAQKVAVNCGSEWFPLTRGITHNEWEGIVNLFPFKGKNNKVLVSVAANYSLPNDSQDKSQSYNVLLEYTI